MTHRHQIVDWNPEDIAAWENGNKKIARRNLFCMMAADHVAFSIWALWSVMVLFMPQSEYGIGTGDKLLISATATLTGAALRIPYTLAVARYGGRNWTVFSALLLLIPTVWTILLLANPGQPLWMYVICAALTGCGGANYAASLANINAFYPHRLKGGALGLSAGIGNLGVAGVQVVGLVVLSTVGSKPYWVCSVYLVLSVAVAIAAALFMDNLDHAIEVDTLGIILRVPDTWVLALLYVGTFGTFIGFSFAFGQVLTVNFIAAGQGVKEASLHAAQYAWIGPLLGALSRIYGGRLSDRVGGSRVTFVVFVGMIATTAALIAISIHSDHSAGHTTAGTMVGYVTCLLCLFTLAGFGKGSVFKMIPAVIEARSHSLGIDETERRHWSRSASGALIGFAAATGAAGGVGVDMALRASYHSTGSDTSAFCLFLVIYAAAAAITWLVYVRRPYASRSVMPGRTVVEPLATVGAVAASEVLVGMPISGEEAR
ncbi:MFS transporter [Mycolicibacter icosiumassiliensis]|uniref:MFS transporter n=1 Tax=Mycolicibacter icosiumassiliensis TaxID=1792835 RepID=UPI0008318D90|nr:nitrate/nitrite transporter [Mycolicibacter icosiumassiliensis]